MSVAEKQSRVRSATGSQHGVSAHRGMVRHRVRVRERLKLFGAEIRTEVAQDSEA